MTKYRVLYRTTVEKEVEVEANSFEEAVKLSNPPMPGMTAIWVGRDEEIHLTGEHEYEIMGRCEICDTPILDRKIPGQWNFATSEDGCFVCYKCAKAAEKEEPCPPSNL